MASSCAAGSASALDVSAVGLQCDGSSEKDCASRTYRDMPPAIAKVEALQHCDSIVQHSVGSLKAHMAGACPYIFLLVSGFPQNRQLAESISRFPASPCPVCGHPQAGRPGT